ncbi:hypothetical protein [Streptomyces sp. 142MFCol3.1]|nr:hypothetical protein [Streptomyces sp. 142MFCol3.1]
MTASAFLSCEDPSHALGLGLSPGDTPGRIDTPAGPVTFRPDSATV